MRSFGPGRSPSTATSRPTRPAAARIDSIVPAWRSRSACEKLRRKTSTPASIRRSRTAGSQLAGPTVAMIFVRRPTTLLVGVIFACTFMTVESARLPQNVTPIYVTLI